MQFATLVGIVLLLLRSQQLEAAENHHFPLFLQKPSAMILLFMLVVPGTYHQPVTENHIAPIVADLSTMTRLINGITLQSDFMRSSENLDPVLAEFLNIGDSNAIPELLKIEVSTLSADVQGLLEVVKTLPASTSQSWEGIGTALSVLKSVNVTDIKNAIQLDMQPVEKKWTAAFKTGLVMSSEKFVKGVVALNYVLTTKLDEGYAASLEMIDNLKDLENGIEEIKNVFSTMLSNFFDPLWDLIDTQQSFEQLSQIAKLAKKYSDNFPAFDSLSQSFLSMNTSVSVLDPVIKKSQQSLMDNKTLEAIKSVFSSLTDRNLLAGLPNGVADLKTLFDDLNGKWLKDQFKGKDMNMLATALEPLKKFYETLKPVDASWNELKKFPEAHQIVQSISSLLQHGKPLKPDDLVANANQSSQCVSGLQDLSRRSLFTDFETFHNGLQDLFEALTKAKGIIETVVKSKHFTTITQFHKHSFGLKFRDTTREAVQEDVDRVKNYTNISEIVQLLNDYVDNISTIELTNVSTTRSLYQASFGAVIPKSLSETGLISAIDCLIGANFDLAGTDGFSKFEGVSQTMKSLTSSQDLWKTLTTAIGSLQSSDKKLKETVDGMKASSKRRRRSASGPGAKGLWKLPNSKHLARDLGDGVQALKGMSEVFKHQDKVKQVAMVSDAVDRVIQSIPKMDTMWTVGNKEALKKLVDDVNSLNTKAGDRLKNRSMESIWKVFEDAQSVKGAPIDAHLLADPVYGVLDSSTQGDVKSGAAPFQDFPPLQLNFASSNLYGASRALQPIATFFADFFRTDLPATTAATPATPATLKDESSSSSIFLFIGIGVGAVILLVLAGIGGFYGWRKMQWNKVWNNRERYWIYNAFFKPKTLVMMIREGKTRDVIDMIENGVFVNTYHEGFTPLHEAVKCGDYDVVEALIKHGADRKALSIDKQTPEELFLILKSKYDPEKDKNMFVKGQQLFITAAFDKYRKKSFRQKLPELMPISEFAIVKPVDRNNEIQYKGTVSDEFFKDTCQMTHCVLEVDKEGVFHFDQYSCDFALNAVFGPTVFCSIEWYRLCSESTANLHKDYEHRITKVEFKGKTYENVDKLKEYARGRHIPYGRRILLNLLVKDPTKYKDSCRMFKKLGFDCDTTIRTANETHKSHYRPELAALIVYEGDSIDEYAGQMKAINKDDFTIMSLDEFIVYLFEMKIPGGDGGWTTKTQSKAEKSKTEQSKTEKSKTGDSVA